MPSSEEALVVAVELAKDYKEAIRLLEALKGQLELIIPASERISKYMEDHTV